MLGGSADTITNSGIIRGDIYLGEGDDSINNTRGTIEGTLFLGSGLDSYLGGTADEDVWGAEAIDTLSGGGGDDCLYGEEGNDVLTGGAGDDMMFGGTNDDVYVVDEHDTIDEVAGEGTNDTVSATTSFALADDDDIEKMQTDLATATTAITLRGNDLLGQSITGNAGVNALSGLGGSDTLNGLGGSDRLVGGTGKDTHTGGTGNDRFVFKTAANSVIGASRDVITDFTVAGTTERIDLSAFAGTFTFRGTGAFSSAGNEVKFQASGANTLVKIDLDADTAAEMEILLIGTKVLIATDFYL